MKDTELNKCKLAARFGDLAERVHMGVKNSENLTMNTSEVFGLLVSTEPNEDGSLRYERLDLATTKKLSKFVGAICLHEHLWSSVCWISLFPGNSFGIHEKKYYIGNAMIVRAGRLYLPIDEELEAYVLNEFQENLVTLRDGEIKIQAFKVLEKLGGNEE